MQEHVKVFSKQSWHHGANFASSPARVLIDFMDPLVVAEKIAVTDKNRIVTERDISEELRRRGKKSRRKICKRKKNVNTHCNIIEI